VPARKSRRDPGRAGPRRAIAATFKHIGAELRAVSQLLRAVRAADAAAHREKNANSR
jgi:hypothetical protein